ncbi:lysophosphatidylcholine acyltransferase 2B-like [Sycon ciliatum]|uniref:lysophosphatidylcholine acyltransferase 2B-like n=1 Tax=Sycon ciliatum TaxID=27933 RepID=UPI0031F708FF
MVRRFPEPAVWNPFKHRVAFSGLEIVELVLGGVFLLPLRILGIIVVFPLVWLTLTIPTIGVKPGQHLSPWRRFFVLNVTTYAVRLILFICGFLWVKYSGKRASYTEVPVNVVAPHVTPFDGFFVGGVVYGSALICSDVLSSLLTSPIVPCTEAIPVNRENAQQRSKVLDLVKTFLSSPGRQTHLVAFPEGTCGGGKSLLSFRRGAFQPGTAVQPIVLDYRARQLISVWSFDCQSPAVQMLLQLSRLYSPLHIKFLDVYRPSEAEKQDPVLYANNVQAVVARELGCPSTQHTRDDGMLVYKALQLGLPADAGCVELGILKQQLGLSMSQLKEAMARFASVNTAKNGHVTQAEMSAYLAWPVQGHVPEMFREYDTGKCNYLTFRDFLLGLVDLTYAVPDQENLKVSAFKALSGGADEITVDGVRSFFEENDIAVSIVESQALLNSWSVLSGAHSSGKLNKDEFATLLRRCPEYLVLLFWTLFGMDGFPPVTPPAAEDKPDRRRRKSTPALI